MMCWISLCSNDLSGGRLQKLALASGAFDGSTSRFGEGMGLNSDVLGSEFFTSDNNLVSGVLGLGDGFGFEKGIKVACRSRGNSIECIQLDQIVFFLGVTGSHRSSSELGQPTVKRLLSSLESRSGRSSGSGLLSTHSETAGGSLSGGDTTSLACLLLAGSRGGAEGIQSEFIVLDVVDVRLIGRASLPVV